MTTNKKKRTTAESRAANLAAKQRKLKLQKKQKAVIPPIDPNKGKPAKDLDRLERILEEELGEFPEGQRKPLVHYLQQYLSGNIKLDISEYHTIPVDPKTFLIDDFYLGLKDDVYPALIDEFCEMNSGKYIEIVLTGGIGTGKTTLAVWNTAYQLYLLSCLKDPHKLFRLDKSSEILIVFQSITADLARKLNYNRFKALIDQSPYFQTRFPYDRRIETELKYPNRIYVRPVSGEDTAAIGQNVIGGIIDEINYMAVTNNSKKSEGGGTYDQAEKVYNSIARRRKSRFMTKGQVAGLLCLVSSRKYPGQFTDRKEEEAKRDKTIYIYDKTIWQIKPEGTYGKERFKVFIGDATRKPRILDANEDPRKTYKPKDQTLIREIPTEFKGDFQTDMVNALREVAGVATLATHPFILNTDAIEPCFRDEIKSIFKEPICNFDDKKLHVIKNNMYAPDIPRFIHLDLSQTGDKTGFAMGCIPRFTTMDRGDIKEVHPVFRLDGALAIEAPQGGEIIYWRIRKLIYALRDMGYNIKWITFDTYQSTDSKQILAQNGFVTGLQSVDTTTLPYELLKSAIYDGRLAAPPHELLQLELARLEKDTKADKIDHPDGFSKDVADAVAGVCHGLMMRREIWISHGINPDNIVNSDIEAMRKSEKKLTDSTNRINRSSGGDGYHVE
ncbi:terminase large subunit [Vibrio phage 1.215.B._10N.222.54.F7]|nr:terminase large subunit [Vibrio phage 1.215.A._10N.222.54.F7]AUR96025.1 terminase large subunit [Vibrio phage 1.215.B._10N.222.54.F7]